MLAERQQEFIRPWEQTTTRNTKNIDPTVTKENLLARKVQTKQEM